MARRDPMAPPALPGFEYIEVLGSGGFADVYLYEQQLPRRRVAVKVLLPERLSDGSIDRFTAEANVMALLSTHPAIVTIHQAGVAADGRPYLVMEYCPKPNLQVRYRREPFSVAEALRVGIQVASAVETAHRAGVLHRDIKPANVLVTEYNRPALTDFGIATTAGAAAEAEGLSIPWSPPEALADHPTSGPFSDVWALGATVYSLLAARSPFEIPGQRNTSVDLIQRIETGPVPPLGRTDTPVSLQRALERAMAKAPGDRFESALGFARALQKIQIELAQSVTPIDILDDGPADADEDDEDDGLTRVRSVVSIDPETSPAAGLTRPAGVRGPVVPPLDTIPRQDLDADTVVRPAAVAAFAPGAAGAAEAAGTPAAPAPAPLRLPPAPGVRPVPAAEPAAPAPAPVAESAPVAAPAPVARRRAVWPWFVAGGAVLVIAAVIVGVSLPAILGGGSPEPTRSAVATSDPQDPIAALVPAPQDVVGTAADGSVVFTWTNPDPQDGDGYLWAPVQLQNAEPTFERVADATVTVPADPSGTTCIDVMLVRDGGRASEPTRACVP